MKASLLLCFTVLAALAVLGCSDPEAAWALAEREDSETTYLEFLAKYPDGETADLARARVKELKAIRAWERAQFKDSINYYQRFIDNFPENSNGDLARARIIEIETDTVWQTIADSDSIKDLEAFLAQYPDAAQATLARTELATLLEAQKAAAPPEREGAFRLQLAAFRTATGADSEVRRLTRLFPDTFLGPIRIEQREPGGLLRLISVPMSGVEARRICKSLKQARQDCMIINR